MHGFVRTLMFAALAGCAAGAAHAQQVAINGGSPSAADVAVTVRASVAQRCGFTATALPSGSRNLGDVTKAFTADFPFAIRCNTPARVGVVSTNGGLRTADAIAAAGYASTAPYEVVLNLVGDAGAAAQGTCQASALAAGAASPCGFRGPATANAGLLLTGVSGDAPGSYLRVRSVDLSQAGVLVASPNYSDRLVVTISPAT